jgi:prevent-host-death family protein
MKVFKISEFKSRCIRILKSVARSREPILITLRGRPLARVEPIDSPEGKRTLGGLRGVMRIHADIIHSDFADDWEPSEK